MCVLQFVFLLLSLTFDAALEGGDSAGARGERFGQRLQRAPSLRPLFFFFFFYGLRPCAPLPPTILVMPDLRLFARRHHLAKPSAMQLKGWETAAPPLGSPRGRRDKSGTGMLASSSPADDLIPELPAGAPSRGVYVRVPFASERTPLREFLWGLAAGTAELGAVLRAPFAGVRRRTLADKLPLWGAAVGDPEGCVTLPPEQARVVAVRRAEAVEARAAAAAAQAAGTTKKGKGGGGGIPRAAEWSPLAGPPGRRIRPADPVQPVAHVGLVVIADHRIGDLGDALLDRALACPVRSESVRRTPVLFYAQCTCGPFHRDSG